MLETEAWAGGWTMTTALNLCRKELRRQRTFHLSPLAEGESNSSTADVYENFDLLNAVSRLSPQQRMATILHYFADLPVAVIANLMTLSEGTVKAHLHQARKRLAATIKGNLV
jgi:RNA polymerase sigma-70 factor, ECF subfamily